MLSHSEVLQTYQAHPQVFGGIFSDGRGGGRAGQLDRVREEAAGACVSFTRQVSGFGCLARLLPFLILIDFCLDCSSQILYFPTFGSRYIALSLTLCILCVSFRVIGCIYIYKSVLSVPQHGYLAG